jgi:hypothetical protein
MSRVLSPEQAAVVGEYIFSPEERRLAAAEGKRKPLLRLAGE